MTLEERAQWLADTICTCLQSESLKTQALDVLAELQEALDEARAGKVDSPRNQSNDISA